MLAHAGQPVAPHDLWRAWNGDPLLLAAVALTAAAYVRGRARRRGARPGQPLRDWCFAGALAALALALVSPLEAVAGSLASAHMVQHVVLVLVVAPLLALSAPLATVLRGSPPAVRAAAVRWRRRLRRSRWRVPGVGNPATVWLLHAGTLWFWHAAVPYDAAVEHHAVHVAEHASFLVTGTWFWRLTIGQATARVPAGLGVLLVFTMAMQSVFLSALLTFATSPWYRAYARSTAAWGLDPLADQQLAGVIMWVPAGLVYVGAGLALLVAWIRDSERAEGSYQPAS